MNPTIAKTIQALFSHPDLHKLPPAGSSMGGENSLIAAPTDAVVVQREARMAGWAEIDCLAPDRWMRIHVFGNEGAYLAFAAVEYFNPEHVPSFEPPEWNARHDMLLMLATAPDAATLSRRIWGKEAVPEGSIVGAMAPMLALVQGFEEHNFMGHLEATAVSRNRQRLFLHAAGDTSRYQQLTKDLGFEVRSVDGATLFLKEVGHVG